jgi:hypothetical protein
MEREVPRLEGLGNWALATFTRASSSHSRRQNFLFAEHVLPVEIGNRRPAQDAYLLRDFECACLELRSVQVFRAELALPTAMFDIRRVCS